MDSKAQDWWSGEYPRYSIKNFQSMPVFFRFMKYDEPFSADDEVRRKAFWVIDNCDIFEWFDRSSQEGEKFGHDRNSDTWFYEHWFTEPSASVVVKTWLCRPVEWGTVIRYFKDREEHAIWNLGNDESVLEEFTQTPEEKKGSKKGIRNTPNGPEDFVEHFSESPEEASQETYWLRGNHKGNTIMQRKGDTTIGKEWTVFPKGSEKKEWQQQGDKKWGSGSGKKSGTSWTENWNSSPEQDYEERQWNDGKTKWGEAMENGKWSMEWKGEKPEFVHRPCQEAQDLLPKLILNYKQQKQLMKHSLKTLEDIGSEGLPAIHRQIGLVGKPKKDDPNDVLDKTGELIRICDEIEGLKKSSESVTTTDLRNTSEQAHRLSNLLIDRTEIEAQAKLKQQRDKIRSETEGASSPNDFLFAIQHYHDLIKDSISSISGSVPSVSSLLEALKASDGTLDKMAAHLADNDEETLTLRKSQKSRIAALPSSQNFMDDFVRLSVDLEHYKQVLMESFSKSQFALLQISQKATNQLAESFDAVPKVEQLSNDGSNDQLAASALKKMTLLTRIQLVLIAKLSGTTDLTDLEDLSDFAEGIKGKKSAGNFDCSDLIRLMWSSAKADQDLTKQAMHNLAKDEDLKTANSLLDQASSATTGQIPSDPSQTLRLFETSLKNYFDARIKQSDLLVSLTSEDDESEDLKPPPSPKGGAMKKKPRQRVRGGKKGGSSELNLTSQVTDALTNSFDTLNMLSSYVLGPREDIRSQIENFAKFKDQVLQDFSFAGTSEDTMGDFFSLMNDIENQKKLVGDFHLMKKLKELNAKLEELIKGACNQSDMPVPENLPKETGESVSERVNASHKLLKELGKALGIDQEDTRDASPSKFQQMGSLNFDPNEALNKLAEQKDNDLATMMFLAEMVGTQEEVDESKAIVEDVNKYFYESTPSNNQEAVEWLRYYFENYQSPYSSLNKMTKTLLNKVLDLLNNPEPSEDDFNKLQLIIENNSILTKKLAKTSSNPPDLQDIQAQAQAVPTKGTLIIPHLLDVSLQQTQINLSLAAEKDPVTEAELKELERTIDKKKFAAPIRSLRPLQPFYKGPYTHDFIFMILKLSAAAKALSEFQKAHPDLQSLQDPQPSEAPDGVKSLKELEEKAASLSTLMPDEVNALGKDYADFILAVLKRSAQEPNSDAEALIKARNDSAAMPFVSWRDIFKSKGADIDIESLCELIDSEQEIAAIYLNGLSKFLGLLDQKKHVLSLKTKSEEIMALEPERKVALYPSLRLEQTKLARSLADNLENIAERLSHLETERSNINRALLNEVLILIPEKESGLLAEAEEIKGKAKEYDEESSDNLAECVIRILGRMHLDSQLAKIKEEANPSGAAENQMLQALRELEAAQLKHLHDSCNTIEFLAKEINPSAESEVPSMRALIKGGSSSTPSEAVSGLLVSIQNGDKMEQVKRDLIAPTKEDLTAVIKLIESEAGAEDTETQNVFTGLFRFAGSQEDKDLAMNLKEKRELEEEQEPETVFEKMKLIKEHLQRLLPTKTAQTELKTKLLKEASVIREEADDIDLQTEDSLKAGIRELGNSILPDDKQTREALDKLKRQVDQLEEEQPVNVSEVIDKTKRRLDLDEKLERLRKEQRDKLGKELSRLRADLQEKQYELDETNSSVKEDKSKLQNQIDLLSSTADQNSALIETLSDENTKKDKQMDEIKNSNKDLQGKIEELLKELQESNEKANSANTDLAQASKDNSEKGQKIAELESTLDAYKKSAEESFKGDKELLDTMQAENEKLRDLLDQKKEEVNNAAATIADLQQKDENNLENKKGLEDAIQQSKAETEKLQKELEDTIQKHDEDLKNAKQEASDYGKDLEKILEDKQNAYEELEESVKDYKRYQPLYYSLKEEKDSQDGAFRQLEVENSDLNRKVGDLAGEIEQLKYKNKMLDKYERDLEGLEKENQKLKHKLEYLEEFSTEKPTQDLINKANEDIATRDKENKRLNDDNEELKKKYKQLESFHQQSVMRNFMIRLMIVFKTKRDRCFRHWRSLKPEEETPPQPIDLNVGVAKPAVPPIPLNIDTEIEESKTAFRPPSSPRPSLEMTFTQDVADPVAADDILRATEAMNIENQQILESNPILLSFRNAGAMNEKPLSYLNIFKFLEELMDRKFDTDKRDIEVRRKPRSMSEFLLEHLQRSFGIPKLATKFLVQFLPSLKKLYEEGHPYASFFCRLLQLFHPDVVPYNMSLYLVRIRIEFHALIEKHDRFKSSYGKKETAATKSKTHGKAAYELAGTGGLALISDVIDLVYAKFATDKECGIVALTFLQPPNVSEEDYLCYRVCHRLATLGKTPDGIFKMIDKDESGSIDYDEFSRALKFDLDVWMNNEGMQKLFDLMKGADGNVSKDAFLQRISVKMLMNWNKNDSFIITKCEFLTALIDVFKYKQTKDFARLMKIVPQQESFDMDSFNDTIMSIDSTLPLPRVEEMFEEIKSNPDKDSVCRVILKYGVGGHGLGVFAIRELLDVLSDRKVTVNVGMEEGKEEETKGIVAASIKRRITVKKTIQKK